MVMSTFSNILLRRNGSSIILGLILTTITVAKTIDLIRYGYALHFGKNFLGEPEPCDDKTNSESKHDASTDNENYLLESLLHNDANREFRPLSPIPEIFEFPTLRIQQESPLMIPHKSSNQVSKEDLIFSITGSPNGTVLFYSQLGLADCVMYYCDVDEVQTRQNLHLPIFVSKPRTIVILEAQNGSIYLMKCREQGSALQIGRFWPISTLDHVEKIHQQNSLKIHFKKPYFWRFRNAEDSVDFVSKLTEASLVTGLKPRILETSSQLPQLDQAEEDTSSIYSL